MTRIHEKIDFTVAIFVVHAEKIYRAITTEEGIRAWWTTD